MKNQAVIFLAILYFLTAGCPDVLCLGVLKMVAKRGICDSRRHKRHYGDDTFCFHVDCFFVPNLTE